MSASAQDTQDFLEAFQKDLRKAPAQRKSDDILDFIRKNWKMFGITRKSMEMLVEELEQRGCLTASALADELGLPDSVLFKRVKVAETAKLLLRPFTSPIMRQFDQQVEKRTAVGGRAAQLCLVVVAGESSLVITNMQTRKQLPGRLYITLVRDSPAYDVELFKIEDAPARMPELFNREGAY